MSNSLEIYTVYDHPKDFPESYVVKRWVIEENSPPVQDPKFLILGRDLGLIRDTMIEMGLMSLGRQQDDDPIIIESYI